MKIIMQRVLLLIFSMVRNSKVRLSTLHVTVAKLEVDHLHDALKQWHLSYCLQETSLLSASHRRKTLMGHILSKCGTKMQSLCQCMRTVTSMRIQRGAAAGAGDAAVAGEAVVEEVAVAMGVVVAMVVVADTEVVAVEDMVEVAVAAAMAGTGTGIAIGGAATEDLPEKGTVAMMAEAAVGMGAVVVMVAAVVTATDTDDMSCVEGHTPVIWIW